MRPSKVVGRFRDRPSARRTERVPAQVARRAGINILQTHEPVRRCGTHPHVETAGQAACISVETIQEAMFKRLHLPKLNRVIALAIQGSTGHPASCCTLATVLNQRKGKTHCGAAFCPSRVDQRRFTSIILSSSDQR